MCSMLSNLSVSEPEIFATGIPVQFETTFATSFSVTVSAIRKVIP